MCFFSLFSVLNLKFNELIKFHYISFHIIRNRTTFLLFLIILYLISSSIDNRFKFLVDKFYDQTHINNIKWLDLDAFLSNHFILVSGLSVIWVIYMCATVYQFISRGQGAGAGGLTQCAGQSLKSYKCDAVLESLVGIKGQTSKMNERMFASVLTALTLYSTLRNIGISSHIMPTGHYTVIRILIVSSLTAAWWFCYNSYN